MNKQTIITAAITALAMVSLGCGDSDKRTTPAATGSPATTTDATPTMAEAAWAARVCETLQTAFAAYASAPGASVDPSSLALPERRQRALSYWTSLLDTAQKLLRDQQAMTPPQTARPLHEAIMAQTQVDIAEYGRSLAEIEAIFGSAAAAEANNARIQAAKRQELSRANSVYQASPRGVTNALKANPACAGTGLGPNPSPTPAR